METLLRRTTTRPAWQISLSVASRTGINVCGTGEEPPRAVLGYDGGMDIETPLATPGSQAAGPAASPDDAPRPSRSGCGCFSLLGGLVLVLVGIPMLVCPGPGLVTILAGFGMIGAGLGLRRRETVQSAQEETP